MKPEDVVTGIGKKASIQRKIKTINTHFDRPTHQKIFDAAHKEDMTASQFVRLAIEHYFSCVG